MLRDQVEKHVSVRLTVAILATVFSLLLYAKDVPQFELTTAQLALVAQAEKLGVSDLETLPAPEGGFVLAGKLEGDQFSVAFPAAWEGGALLFAHGYSTPGSPVAVADDPLSEEVGTFGLMLEVYRDGYAAGHSAYDKAGMGVETASENTLRLRHFLADLGADRILLAGGSMGGNVVIALIEQHPKAFHGAISACGVTDGWESLHAQLIDMRAAYNVVTEGTFYALPGDHDLLTSALPMDPPSGASASSEIFRSLRIMRVTAPILALATKAASDPTGHEARTLRQVASIGGFEPEAASIIFPLVTISLGMDDMMATFGGSIYDNTKKSYASTEMTVEEVAAFNAKVQRIRADPAAVAKARKWRQATGRFAVPLVTIHNRIDSLVPYAQSEALGRIVKAAGNSSWLTQYTVPGVKAPLPLVGIEGYVHCGFTPEQMAAIWEALRGWVETGKRPDPGAVQ